MANTFKIHASDTKIIHGLPAQMLYRKIEHSKPQLAVLCGRFQKQMVLDRGKKQVKKLLDMASNSQALFASRQATPFKQSDGRVHDASIIRVKTQRGGSQRLLTAPQGDGKFIVHLETGIPQHWDLNEIAGFMLGKGVEDFFTHGSERIDDGSGNVLAHRIRWQRPKTRIADVRIYSGDIWEMSPGSEIFVHDITGRAFRVVCTKDGIQVVDHGASNALDQYCQLVESRKGSYVVTEGTTPQTT